MLHPVAARALVGVAGCGLLIACGRAGALPADGCICSRSADGDACDPGGADTTCGSAGGDGDRVFAQSMTTRDDSGLRAVETRAILSVGHSDVPLASALSRRTAVRRADAADASQREVESTETAAPREVLLRAENPDRDASTIGQPQYVVLTTWEEMRTSPRNAGIISDYDADATAQPQLSDAAKRADGQGTVRITVTRMIFAVYPVDARTARPAPSAKPAHAEDSGQPPAPSAESGWLVLQL